MSYRDRVQVYKDETVAGGGTASDSLPYPSTINPTQDAIESAGLILNDFNAGSPVQDQTVRVERTGNDLVLTDVTNGSVSVAALARNYDYLLMNDPDRVSNSLTVTRVLGAVSKLTWVDNSTSKTIKTVDFTRFGGVVTTVVTKVYAADGTTVVAQTTETISRSGGLVTGMSITRDV